MDYQKIIKDISWCDWVLEINCADSIIPGEIDRQARYIGVDENGHVLKKMYKKYGKRFVEGTYRMIHKNIFLEGHYDIIIANKIPTKEKPAYKKLLKDRFSPNKIYI